MIVEKDGIKYILTNEIQISAFLNSGWQEVKETKKVKRKVNTKENSED